VYCHIETHDISQAPETIAISYTWGIDGDHKQIYLNSRPHRVRHNCWSALQQVAERKIEGSIGIDTICINQADIHEKAK
ncbi:hypothetical protein DOTSEDRAFT_153943, partial [Dothistroma septosporum NZE10]